MRGHILLNNPGKVDSCSVGERHQILVLPVRPQLTPGGLTSTAALTPHCLCVFTDFARYDLLWSLDFLHREQAGTLRSVDYSFGILVPAWRDVRLPAREWFEGVSSGSGVGVTRLRATEWCCWSSRLLYNFLLAVSQSSSNIISSSQIVPNHDIGG